MKLNVENTYNAKYLAMLPHWKCHKVVQAGKISFMARDEPNGQLMIHAEPSNMPFAVPLDFLYRHNPELGGYLVVYEDGYLSYSPAEAFEAGYATIIDKDSNGTVLAQKADGTETLTFQDSRPAADYPSQVSSNFLWRKKPVVIEAFQWTGDKDQLGEPEWIVEAIKTGVVGIDAEGLNIVTLEGVLTASHGDWIIRGVKGELYPCKPDIFASTYEPADEDPATNMVGATGGPLDEVAGQQLKAHFLAAWRTAEGLAYEYSHSLPEGDERNYAMNIYHRVRLLFSDGKSGMTQDAGHVSEKDDRNDLIMELQLIGEDYGCPAGMNRFAWLRARLDTLARLENATSPVNQDGADFSDALVWLKNGEHVRRAGWNGKGLWLELIEPHTSVDLPFIRLSYPVPGNGSLPYPDGARVPWAPSQTDMLATDWELAD